MRLLSAAKVLAILAACSLFAWVAHAATSDNGDVSFTIQPIDSLSATDGGAIVLTGTAGEDLLTGTADGTARLNYSHNGPNPRKLLAEVKPGDNPAGHDLSLGVQVASSGPKVLVLNGASQGAVEILGSIPTGAYSQRTVTYLARCTASGTQVSSDTDFVFTVTFTTTD